MFIVLFFYIKNIRRRRQRQICLCQSVARSRTATRRRQCARHRVVVVVVDSERCVDDQSVRCARLRRTQVSFLVCLLRSVCFVVFCAIFFFFFTIVVVCYDRCSLMCFGSMFVVVGIFLFRCLSTILVELTGDCSLGDDTLIGKLQYYFFTKIKKRFF